METFDPNIFMMILYKKRLDKPLFGKYTKTPNLESFLSMTTLSWKNCSCNGIGNKRKKKKNHDESIINFVGDYQ